MHIVYEETKRMLRGLRRQAHHPPENRPNRPVPRQAPLDAPAGAGDLRCVRSLRTGYRSVRRKRSARYGVRAAAVLHDRQEHGKGNRLSAGTGHSHYAARLCSSLRAHGGVRYRGDQAAVSERSRSGHPAVFHQGAAPLAPRSSAERRLNG